MAPPRNTAQDLISLRLRLQEAYEELSNTPVGDAQRHHKFGVLQTLTNSLKTMDRLKDGFQNIVIQTEPRDRFIAMSLNKEDIVADLNMDYTEEFQLKADDPRLTEAFCKEFAKGWGEVVYEAACRRVEFIEMDMWTEFMEEMHEKIGATKEWFGGGPEGLEAQVAESIRINKGLVKEGE